VLFSSSVIQSPIEMPKQPTAEPTTQPTNESTEQLINETPMEPSGVVLGDAVSDSPVNVQPENLTISKSSHVSELTKSTDDDDVTTGAFVAVSTAPIGHSRYLNLAPSPYQPP
jgi:hypothetical protein